MKEKYLLRKLEVEDRQGIKTVLSLVYFEADHIDDGKGGKRYVNINVFPFDRERPGYVYMPEMKVRIN